MPNRTRPVILTLLALVLAATPELAAAGGPAPKAVVPGPVWNAGPVAKGDRLSTDFVIRNEGDAELVLLEVNPACGCTVAKFDARIPPGGSGKVHAELDTTGFLGPIAKGITVLTNDPANPRLQLTIQAQIEARLRAHPGYARYIYVQGHGEASIAQTVWALDHPDFEVVEVVSPYPFLAVSFREATEAERRPEAVGRQWRVVTTLQPDAPVGALTEPVLIRTNHPREPEMDLTVSGFVRPLFAATPAVIDFGPVELEEEKLLGVALVNFGSEPVEVVAVESSVPGIEGSAEVVQAGHRFGLRLLLRPEIAKGAVHGVIRVRTTSARQPVFEIPVKGTVL
ncbi:MAG TPA: DUF1573 domain-containing protein [Thermoanaerobaculia bacterium]|nr:DUF1573 domain-containing protein [Thermoanaerobaculia bacterium]